MYKNRLTKLEYTKLEYTKTWMYNSLNIHNLERTKPWMYKTLNLQKLECTNLTCTLTWMYKTHLYKDLNIQNSFIQSLECTKWVFLLPSSYFLLTLPSFFFSPSTNPQVKAKVLPSHLTAYCCDSIGQVRLGQATRPTWLHTLESHQCAIKWKGWSQTGRVALNKPNLAYGITTVCGQVGGVIARCPSSLTKKVKFKKS